PRQGGSIRRKKRRTSNGFARSIGSYLRRAEVFRCQAKLTKARSSITLTTISQIRHSTLQAFHGTRCITTRTIPACSESKRSGIRATSFVTHYPFDDCHSKKH